MMYQILILIQMFKNKLVVEQLCGTELKDGRNINFFLLKKVINNTIFKRNIKDHVVYRMNSDRYASVYACICGHTYMHAYLCVCVCTGKCICLCLNKVI